MPIVTTIPALFPGSIAVQIHTGAVYRIEKTKQVKAVCMDVKGGLWDVRMESLRDATPEEKALFEAQAPKSDPADVIRLGHVVRFKGANAAKYPGVYVVIKDKDAAVTLVKAGGDLGSKYFPTVLTSQLEVVKEPVTITNV